MTERRSDLEPTLKGAPDQEAGPYVMSGEYDTPEPRTAEAPFALRGAPMAIFAACTSNFLATSISWYAFGPRQLADTVMVYLLGIVLVSLRSVPPGAMVLIGDKEFGPTPTQIEFRGVEAEPGRQVTFRFRRTGYRALMVTREVHGDTLDVQASFMDPIVRKPNTTEPTGRAPRAVEPGDIATPRAP